MSPPSQFFSLTSSGSPAFRAEQLTGGKMAETEEKQTISQMYHLKEKEEVVAGESEQPTEEVTSEATANEEETKEAPVEEESVADAETTAEEETAEEESEPKLKVEDIKTAPVDFRFPTTNQTRHCFTRYIEYHKCVASKGEGASECDKYAKYYRSLCPGEWVDNWNEQRANGTFPGPL